MQNSLYCDSLVGVNELAVAGKQFNVSPNPSNGAFTISLHKKYKNISIRITDVLGNVVYQTNVKETEQIPITLNTASGVYFITIIADDKRQVLKIVKQ